MFDRLRGDDLLFRIALRQMEMPARVRSQFRSGTLAESRQRLPLHHPCRSSDFLVQREAVTLPYDSGKSGKMKVHSGDQKRIGDGHIQHTFARIGSLMFVGVENNTHIGVCNLNVRQMDKIAPDQQRVWSGSNAVARVTGGVPWQRDSIDVWQHIPAPECPDTIPIGRKLAASGFEIVPTLARTHRAMRPSSSQCAISSS